MNGFTSWIAWFGEIAFAISILFVEATLKFLWPILKLFLIPFEKPFELFFPKYGDAILESDFVEMATSNGFTVEEHHVETRDGYILGLHRLGSKDKNPTHGPVLLMHGFLMCSEGWIARYRERALPYILVNAGFDVWLGNNRGNKYSYKHLKYSPTDEKFWNFCIDDLARYDLSALIYYILDITQTSKLSYIGFSQGTAQAFAGFSAYPDLASKIKIFIALAPATTVKPIHNPAVEGVSASRPKLLFLLFGKKAMIAQTLFWRRMLGRDMYVYIIDTSMRFLFGWQTTELDPQEKPLMYSHLYSYSSVKTVVHWFQIMKTGVFQMFDDNIHPKHVHRQYNGYHLPRYNLSKITCKTALFWGSRDTLPNMTELLQHFPNSYVQREDAYEHLDFIWAKNAPERVFSKVVKLLSQQD